MQVAWAAAGSTSLAHFLVSVMDAAQAFAVTAAVTTGYYDILTGPDSMKALFQVQWLNSSFSGPFACLVRLANGLRRH